MTANVNATRDMSSNAYAVQDSFLGIIFMLKTAYCPWVNFFELDSEWEVQHTVPKLSGRKTLIC